ncbi:MAG TPA: diacylglycerol kinase family protein [Cryomorphaceae bacterium]|nr:diacylglycerol kinase family protein [Cryomorphaceae bacterium]
MKILLVVNPISGDINKEEFTATAVNRCNEEGHEVKVFKTTGENDLERIRKEIHENSPDRLLSLGGDGNFILCCESAEGKNIPVGLIPMGSANGLALELGIPKNYSVALELFLKTTKVHHLDAICVNDHMHCVHLGDVGINAEIVKDFDEDESRGMLTYAKHLTKALAETQPFQVQVESEGKRLFEGEVVMVGIGNCRRYGTGVYLTGYGNPFDGLFELILIDKMSVSTILRKGLTLLNKEVANGEDTKILQLKEAKISLTEKRLLQLDGEPEGRYDNLILKMKKAYFPVIISENHTFTAGNL